MNERAPAVAEKPQADTMPLATKVRRAMCCPQGCGHQDSERCEAATMHRRALAVFDVMRAHSRSLGVALDDALANLAGRR